MTQKCQSEIYLGFESFNLPRPTKMSFQKVSWWHVNSGTGNHLAVTTRDFERLHKPLWELSKSLAPGTQASVVRLLWVALLLRVSVKEDVVPKSLLSHLWVLYPHTKHWV